MAIRVPRVHIFIPGNTSRSRYEPAYVLPILQREHHGRLADPAFGIRIEAHPIECQSEHFLWKTVISVDEERALLVKTFGDSFFACYPTERDFKDAFRLAIDDAARLEDATERELAIREVNTGIFCFEATALAAALEGLRADNSQGEYYLPDTLPALRASASLAKRLITAAQNAVAARAVATAGNDNEE